MLAYCGRRWGGCGCEIGGHRRGRVQRLCAHWREARLVERSLQAGRQYRPCLWLEEFRRGSQVSSSRALLAGAQCRCDRETLRSERIA